jgi:hypothetical protein
MLKGDFQGLSSQWQSMTYQPLANLQDVQGPWQIKCADFAGRKSQRLRILTARHGDDVHAANIGQLQKNGKVQRQSQNVIKYSNNME